jgi:dinuclear metal center YbgI/SA1388 family protein
MTPTVSQIIDTIDKEIAPGGLAESWDNCGLCAGNPDWPAKKILIGLDPGMPVMQAARAWQADMVLTHHPLFITPEKTIDFRTLPGSAIAMAAIERIAIVCAHTSLDKAWNGLNDFFSDCINLVPTRPLAPDARAVDPGSPMTGFGRIGPVYPPVSVSQMAARIKKGLGLNRVRLVGDPERMVRQVAVCTGSGGGLIPEFLECGADLYVTGDIKYHDARLVESHGRALIDVGHFASEIIAVDLLSRKLKQAATRAGYDLEIKKFTQETDPFTLV